MEETLFKTFKDTIKDENDQEWRKKPHKSWAMTINNYTDKDIKLLNDIELSYLVCGKEVGEKGTPHLQICLTFSVAKRFNAMMLLFPTAHFRPTIETEAARNYCMKDKEYFIRDYRKQGQRTDLQEFAAKIKNESLESAIDAYPTTYILFHSGSHKLNNFYKDKKRNFKPEVIWIHGPTGSGKTRYVVDREPDLWLSGRDLKFWENYNHEEAILLDDFRADFCTFHELLRILDRYPYRVNLKGSSTELNSKRIYITSPYHPSEVYNKTEEDQKQLLRRISQIIFLDNINGLQTL